jgi:hypothetical protein
VAHRKFPVREGQEGVAGIVTRRTIRNGAVARMHMDGHENIIANRVGETDAQGPR